MAKADVLITEDPGFESQVSHYFFHVAELTVSATKLFVALVINKARLWMTLEVPDWSLMPGPHVDFNQQGILGRCANFLYYMLRNKGAKNTSFCKRHHSSGSGCLEDFRGS